MPAIHHTRAESGSTFNQSISLDHAFFPFYPLMMRLFAYPLRIFGLNPIATATLAGVIISALGTLLGMLALFDLTRDSLGEEGAVRASFYLIIFPTGFFLIQVYTEGLFVGLTFGTLAFLRRGQWSIAAVLAVCAMLTRAVGVLLIIPMLIFWIRSHEWKQVNFNWRQTFSDRNSRLAIGRGLLALLPLVAYFMWKYSYFGRAFDYVEANYYGRGFLSLSKSFHVWSEALRAMLAGTNLPDTAYYLTEVIEFTLALIASLAVVRTHPEIAWFSLAVIFVSWASGSAQSVQRYVLSAPAVFIGLARWGANPIFDRAWTMLSLLLLGLLAMLFAFNMWVA